MRGVYPPPIDLSKNMFPYLPQHNKQDGRKKGAQTKYLSKDFDACLNPFSPTIQGKGPCLLTIILCHKDSNSREKCQSHLANKALLCKLKFPSSNLLGSHVYNQMRPFPFLYPFPKEVFQDLPNTLQPKLRVRER